GFANFIDDSFSLRDGSFGSFRVTCGLSSSVRLIRRSASAPPFVSADREGQRRAGFHKWIYLLKKQRLREVWRPGGSRPDARKVCGSDAQQATTPAARVAC